MRLLDWLLGRRRPRTELYPRCAACRRAFADGDLVDVNDAGDGTAFCHNDGQCVALYAFRTGAMVIANTRTYRAVGSYGE